MTCTPSKTNAMTESLTSLDNVPEAVLKDVLMPLIGPRDLIPSLGSCRKDFRRTSTSNAVWQEFCRWRGTNMSKVYKAAKVPIDEELDRLDGNDNTRRARWVAFKTVFEAFQEASLHDGSYERYKALHVQSLPSRQTQCCCFSHELDADCPDQAVAVCQKPNCGIAFCGFHNTRDSVQILRCDWCRASFCSLEKLISRCTCCNKTACLDCNDLVGLGPRSRRCASDEYCPNETCWKCSWIVVGPDNEAQARRCGSRKQFESGQVNVFCGSRCAWQEVRFRSDDAIHELG
jgi:hypothetical protein